MELGKEGILSIRFDTVKYVDESIGAGMSAYSWLRQTGGFMDTLEY